MPMAGGLRAYSANQRQHPQSALNHGFIYQEAIRLYTPELGISDALRCCFPSAAEAGVRYAGFRHGCRRDLPNRAYSLR